MSSEQVITRFAPSPTGMLHIGSARTALFNWLYARHTGGKFLLRIEDTDKARSTQPAIDAIVTSMKWLGLEWNDEVVYQSARAVRHAEVALQLLAKGQAYYCYETPEELLQKREAAKAEGKVYKYDRKWRESKEEPPAGVKPSIRIKAPLAGETVILDSVQGDVTIKNSELDDMVILRGDGTPTYMLAVVVDDSDMAVTHIIRGDDHLTNSARQMIIYEAMGWQAPIFAHIPLIHGPDGAKLSKRHGALGVEAYRDMGYLPEALCNYLLRLGWSHGDDEIISREQAVKWFDISGIGKAPARLDFDKMKNLNGHYIRSADDERLVGLIVPILEGKFGKISPEIRTRLKKAMPSLKERAKTIVELADSTRFIIQRPIDSIDSHPSFPDIIPQSNMPIAVGGNATEPPLVAMSVIEPLRQVNDWNAKKIETEVKEFISKNNLKPGDVLPKIRVALTGSKSSPGGVFEIMEILGKEESLKRLGNA